MPYQIRKIRNKKLYSVKNPITGQIHSAHTTKKNAKKQIQLLMAIEHGFKPKGYDSDSGSDSDSDVEGGAKANGRMRVGMGVNDAELKNFVKASYKKKKDAKVEGYELDRNLSTKRTKVYTKDGKAIVAHAGTDSITDWANNLLIPFGLHTYSSRYKNAKKIQEEANKKYGKENIETISHSQSGHIANNLAKEGLTQKGQNTTLNPAILNPFDKHKGVSVVKSSGDVVSALTHTGKHDKVIKAKTYNPLKEHSPDILGGYMCGGNRWVDHVKAFAKANNLAYGCAISNPQCKASYKKISKKSIKVSAPTPAPAPKKEPILALPPSIPLTKLPERVMKIFNYMIKNLTETLKSKNKFNLLSNLSKLLDLDKDLAIEIKEYKLSTNTNYTLIPSISNILDVIKTNNYEIDQLKQKYNPILKSYELAEEKNPKSATTKKYKKLLEELANEIAILEEKNRELVNNLRQYLDVIKQIYDNIISGKTIPKKKKMNIVNELKDKNVILHKMDNKAEETNITKIVENYQNLKSIEEERNKTNIVSTKFSWALYEIIRHYIDYLKSKGFEYSKVSKVDDKFKNIPDIPFDKKFLKEYKLKYTKGSLGSKIKVIDWITAQKDIFKTLTKITLPTVDPYTGKTDIQKYK